MKTLIKISAWAMIVFGLLFLLASIILVIVGVVNIGNPGNLARPFLPRSAAILSTLILGLILLGIGELVYLLYHMNENALSEAPSTKAKADSSVKKK